jgi:hypothetical protein
MKRIAWITGSALLALLTVAVVAHAVSDDLEVTGDIRVRLRHVDSGRQEIRGTYGEILNRGISLKHRFMLEACYPVSSVMRIGGLVRVSNEDEQVLESGPEYFSSPFGSAFAAYETPTVISRLGYYPISYTPLSLMRWDIKDDPEGGGGGCAVCGAVGVGGLILGETVEELGPTVTFEGLKLDLAPTETFGLNGFLARPRTAGTDYQIITYGGKAGFKRYVKRLASFVDIAVLAVRSEEDEKSVENSDAPPDHEPFKNTVYGLTWQMPLLTWLSLSGEATATETQRTDEATGLLEDLEGKGIIGSVALEIEGTTLEASYVHLCPEWDSYFRALSYNPNREGVRLRFELDRKVYLIALFARYLRSVDPLPTLVTAQHIDLPHAPGKRLAYPTVSARGYLRVTPNLNLGLAGIYSGEGVEEASVDPRMAGERLTISGALTYEFGKDAAVTLEERLIRSRIDEAKYLPGRSPGIADYDVAYTSLYVKAAIW